MEYDTKTYFDENEADDVKGFTIIDANEDSDRYHIAEKWNKTEGGGKFRQYWIPAAQLQSRVTDGKCEPKAKLTQEQYAQVCDMIDHENVVADEASA